MLELLVLEFMPNIFTKMKLFWPSLSQLCSLWPRHCWKLLHFLTCYCELTRGEKEKEGEEEEEKKWHWKGVGRPEHKKKPGGRPATYE